MNKWDGEYCNDCKQSYNTVWSATDELWKKLGFKDDKGLLCIPCAIRRANKLGLTIHIAISEDDILNIVQ